MAQLAAAMATGLPASPIAEAGTAPGAGDQPPEPPSFDASNLLAQSGHMRKKSERVNKEKIKLRMKLIDLKLIDEENQGSDAEERKECRVPESYFVSIPQKPASGCSSCFRSQLDRGPMGGRGSGARLEQAAGLCLGSWAKFSLSSPAIVRARGSLGPAGIRARPAGRLRAWPQTHGAHRRCNPASPGIQAKLVGTAGAPASSQTRIGKTSRGLKSIQATSPIDFDGQRPS